MEFPTKSAVRTCGLSFSGNLVMYTTDKAMSQPCEMLVYDLRDESQISKQFEVLIQCEFDNHPCSSYVLVKVGTILKISYVIWIPNLAFQ